MPKRRSRGDGGLHWDEARQRWIASVTVGYFPSGKRIVKKGSGRTKTEAKTQLRQVVRDYEDGLAIAPAGYTVKDALNDWLAFGLSSRNENTVETLTILCSTHVIPDLGRLKLRDLSAENVERWLAVKSETLSTRSLQALRSCLNRAVRRAMARDKVKRNVVELVSVPTGCTGRASKALTFAQAEAILASAKSSRLHAYIVVSLLTRGTHRGAARPAVGGRRSGRQARFVTTRAALPCRLALRPQGRRHHDPQVAAHHRPAPALRRRAPRATRPAGVGPTRSRRQVARARAGVRLRRRHAARPRPRTPGLPARDQGC